LNPQLTLYRSIELSSVWVVSLHIFAGNRRARTLVLYLWIIIALAVLSSLWIKSTLNPLAPNVLRSNSMAPMAAVLALLCLRDLLHRSVTLWRLTQLSVAVWLFFAFDSLASLGALLAALSVLTIFTLRGRIRIAVGALLGLSAVVALSRYGLTEAFAAFGGAAGKEQQYVDSWTGRLPLWEFVIGKVQSRPHGYGLGSDRLLTLIDSRRQIGWQPLHAHSGYFAALFGGGVVALTLVVAAFVSCFTHALRRADWARPTAVAIVTLLAVNNLTIVGSGAVMSSSFLVLLSILASDGRVLGPRSDPGDESPSLATSSRPYGARR
jgi:O-antigen ligase